MCCYCLVQFVDVYVYRRSRNSCSLRACLCLAGGWTNEIFFNVSYVISRMKKNKAFQGVMGKVCSR